MGHYTIILTFYRSLGKNAKNILKGEYQKDEIKYEDRGGEGGGGDTSTIPITIFICLWFSSYDLLHLYI